MLTRCPRCDTTFRVTPEQLKARQGRVRCGSCQAVFNALETLVDELAIGTPPTGGVQDFAIAPEAHPTPTEAAPPADTTPAEPMPPLVADLAPEAPVLPDVFLEPWPLPVAIDTEPVVGAVEAPVAAEIAEPLLEALPESSDADAQEPDTEDKPEPGIEADGEAAVRESLPLPEPLHAPAPAPAPAPEPEPEPAAEPWPGPEPLLHDDEQPHRRWPWVVGSVLALAVLGLQVVMHNRVELAVLAPETKPALLAACELFGCELSLPRKIEQIGIEASDLHPDPSAEHRLDLTATLRNRAPFPQVWPALELTLTDTDDKALVRRVLAPEEYLPEKISPTAGFPAGGEQAISLAIDAKDVAAVGYRLYVFYP